LDPAAKQKLRRTAKRLHWFVQIAMILALIALPFEQDLRGMLGDTYAHLRLREIDEAVSNTVGRFYFDRQRDLVAFIPPTDPAARPAWATSIGDFLGEPAAVFLQQGGTIDWFTVPAACRTNLPRVELALRSSADSLWRKNRADTLGAMSIRRTLFELDSNSSLLVWAVGPLGDSLRWGIFECGECYKQSWRTFCQRLTRATAMPLLEPASAPLEPWLCFERNQHPPRNASTRISIDGELLYQSPSLDTTAAAHVEEAVGIRREYFLGYTDQQIRANLAATRFTWRSVIFPILMMLTVYTFYRWILKLTEPVEG
jgi:hypothetical protein